MTDSMGRRKFLAVTGGGVAAASSASLLGASPVAPSTLFSGRAYPPESGHAELRKRSTEARKKDPRPNILFLFTDQQTLNALSCTGNPWLHTPNLDALAARSVRFEHSICTSPICTPSRASLFTGLMPHQTGSDYLDQPLKPGVSTVGERLLAAGYDTTYIGKWHVPASFPKKADAIPGFTYLPLPELKRHHLGDITDFILATDAEFYLRWHASLSPNPWFLAVSLHNPHDICYHCMQKPPPHPGGPMLPELPKNFEISKDEPEMVAWRRAQSDYAREMPNTKDWSEADWRTYLYAYYRWVEAADRSCGIVLDALKQGGWDENTLVVFTSDHGEGMAAHRWVTKLSLYQESLSVPLMVRFPGQTQGWVDKTSLASGIDLVPTFLDYANAKADPALPGTSLRPALEKQKKPLREVVFAEMAVNPHHPEWHARCAADGRYKYIAYSMGERPEQLFDLNADPGETRNIAGHPDAAAVLARMRKAMSGWLAKTADPFVLPPSSGLAARDLGELEQG